MCIFVHLILIMCRPWTWVQILNYSQIIQLINSRRITDFLTLCTPGCRQECQICDFSWSSSLFIKRKGPEADSLSPPILYQELNQVKEKKKKKLRLLWKKSDSDCCLLQVAYIMCQPFCMFCTKFWKQKETFIKCMCREMYISYIFVRIVIEPYFCHS